MLIRFTLAIFTLVLLTFISGCTKDPNQEANKLYTEATQLIRTANATAGSYTEYHTSFTQAQDKLNRILSRYPSSNIAVGLSSGRLELEGASFDQLELLDIEIRSLIDSESNPLSTMVLLANHVDPDLPGFNEAYIQIVGGKYDNGLRIADNLEITDRLRLKILTAELNIERDNEEKGIEILSESFRLISKNETIAAENSFPIWDYRKSDIVKLYISLGKHNSAFKVIENINTKNVKAESLILLAESFNSHGNIEKSKEMLNNALDLFPIDGDHSIYRSQIRKKVAIAFWDFGMTEESIEILRTMRGRHPYLEVMIHIAESRDNDGLNEAAVDLLDLAVSSVKENANGQPVSQLIDASLAFHRLRSPERAQELINEAHEMIDFSNPHTYYFEKIITAYIEMGEYDIARGIIDSITDRKNRKYIEESVTTSAAASENLTAEEILQVLTLTEDERSNDYIIFRAFDRYLDNGSMIRAKELINELSFQVNQDEASVKVIEALITLNQIDKASHVLTSINELPYKLASLRLIVVNEKTDQWLQVAGSSMLVELTGEVRPIRTFWRDFLAENGSANNAPN